MNIHAHIHFRKMCVHVLLECSLRRYIGTKLDCKYFISSNTKFRLIYAFCMAIVAGYGTEFLFLNREGFPTEEEQYAAYRNVAVAMKPHEVIVRTLDVGGDKILHGSEHSREANPFLGWRGVRFCLDQPEMFKTQLRAILRASAEGNVKMMYPMISDLQEVKRANELLNICREELRREEKPFSDQMEVGLMIEVPSAAMIADVLAEHAAFFSIGTNDLVQYSMAVDRGNERVAHLYAPAHPAILRLIKNVVAAARARNIWVGVCGEMAGDPIMVPLLVGLGVNELSVSAVALPAACAKVKL